MLKLLKALGVAILEIAAAITIACVFVGVLIVGFINWGRWAIKEVFRK